MTNRYAAALETAYPSLVAYAAAKGYRHPTFQAEDIVQAAAVRYLERAAAGRYETATAADLRLALRGLVRQTGYRLYRAAAARPTTTDPVVAAATGATATETVADLASNHEEGVAATEVLDLAYAYAPGLRAALVAGDSIATWGASAGLGATTAKVVAREAATAAYLYAAGVPVADHDHRAYVAAVGAYEAGC